MPCNPTLEDLLCNPGSLLAIGREPTGDDAAVASIGSRPERFGTLETWQQCLDLVCEVEDDTVGPTVDTQRQRLCGFPIRAREVHGEVGEVLKRSATPFIDRLIGVANGRHCQATGEDRSEQPALGWIGVLVLIEKHGVVPAGDSLSDLVESFDDGNSEGDEVAVLEEPEVVFCRCKILRCAHERCSLRPYVVGSARHERENVGCGQQVGRQRLGHGEEFLLALRERGEVEVGCFEIAKHAVGQFRPMSIVHERCCGFVSDKRTELVEDGCCEAVVGGDLDFSSVFSLTDRSMEAYPQFVCCFVGEGDTKGACGVASCFDRCSKPFDDRRGLACSRTGDDA